MLARATDEDHRVSTPLELLFDLTFVVAVSQAAASLAHGLGEGHTGRALLGYVLVFFAIWWAWMNFTWFASAYDTDDVPYRLLTLLQMAGVLVLAAGIGPASDGYDYRTVTLGYVVMRLAMVAQWLRAGLVAAWAARGPVGPRAHPPRPPVRRGDRRAAGAVDAATAPPARPAGGGRRVVRRAGRRGAHRPLLGRAARRHDLAPPPHRRAVRPVHDHCPGRVRARRDDRAAGGGGRVRLEPGAAHDRRGRAGPGLRALVALLLAGGGTGAGAAS